jgi:hypothetical protein
LTADQLNQIRFPDLSGVSAQIDSQGFVTPAYPRILSFSRTGPTTFSLTWNSMPGRQYLVEYKTSASSSTWTTIGDVITTEGSTGSYSDSTAGDSVRFYHVVLLPVAPST